MCRCSSSTAADGVWVRWARRRESWRLLIAVAEGGRRGSYWPLAASGASTVVLLQGRLLRSPPIDELLLFAQADGGSVADIARMRDIDSTKQAIEPLHCRCGAWS